MALLPILEFPDPRLRTKAKPVTQFNAKLTKLTEDMLETMYAAEGIGLAATQVNVHRRVLVIDISEQRNQPQIFINPDIKILVEDLESYREGCLSVPGFYEEVTRPNRIEVTYNDLQGQTCTLLPEGLLAVCLQHEVDHLNGKLFVDHISSLKRQRIRKQLEKTRRSA